MACLADRTGTRCQHASKIEPHRAQFPKVSPYTGFLRDHLFIPGPANPDPWNPSLFFDPVLVYSTLGGPNAVRPSGLPQSARVLFVDGSGNAYVAGTTNSPGFPVTPGVVQSQQSSVEFLGFSIQGRSNWPILALLTYIPGIYSLAGLAVDPSGNIFV